MPAEYAINMHRVRETLEKDQLVLIQTNRYMPQLGSDRYTSSVVGKVVEATAETAMIDIEGLGIIQARKPAYGYDSLNVWPIVEIPIVGVNTMKSDDRKLVHAYLDRLAMSAPTNPVAVYVTSVGPEGIAGRLIGEADGDFEPVFQPDDYVSPLGLTNVGDAVVSSELPVVLNGFGGTIGAPEEEVTVSVGDILMSRGFAIEIEGDVASARVVNVAVVGNVDSAEAAADYLGIKKIEEGLHGFRSSLASAGIMHHEYDIGVSRTEPDQALVVFYDDPNGRRAMHLLGASGYEAFVNDELRTYLEHDDLAPGLWVMDNLANHSWTDHEGGYDATVEGDWRPATGADIEALFGSEAIDDELAYVMEIDKEEGLAERMMRAAVTAEFEDAFATRHREFALRRFGIVDEAHWKAAMIANPGELEAYVSNAFAEVEDDRLRGQMSAVLRDEIKSRSSLFDTVVPSSSEKAVLALETNWGKRNPILFTPSTALEQDKDAFVKAVLRNTSTLVKNIDKGHDLSRMGMPQLMRKLYRDGVSAEGMRPFSDARNTGGKWLFGGREKKWITLVLFVNDLEVATLVTSTDSHRLTNAWGLNYTTTVQDGADTRPRVDVAAVALDADRAVCELEARIATNRGSSTDVLCNAAEDGIHSTGRDTAYVADGVLHREDGPALQRGSFFEDEQPLVEHRFRGNLHRNDGPAMYQADQAVWYQHGLEHREDGPSTVIGEDREYRLFDRLHREDGPAVENPAAKVWYANGREHREDGPARVAPEAETWFRRGRMHRTGAPADTYCDGGEAYYENGRLHNDLGPAIVDPDEGIVYALNGTEITESEFRERTGISEPAVPAPRP